ncbi:restriction endonuclease subunit S [Paenibacillus sp. GYB003]|uniref:restriction endonuclease subunit S n=1 Tax=Paenibacillus sp. GYB003 TaxID=2994392 RepID=UPI002F9635C5
MEVKIVKLADVVSHKKEFIIIDDNMDYKRCRVKLHRQGIVLRDIIKGAEIKTKKQQVCKTGQLLVAEIDAKVGGYGIVPEELNGAIVSSHYYLFDIDTEIINLSYLEYFLKTDDFFNQLKPQGSTNYAAIRPSDVLNISIPLQPFESQIEIAKKLQLIDQKLNLFNTKVEKNEQYIKTLRQSILQEAVQGKLIQQNCIDEPACVLLDKIKYEKDRLIKEKKFKKEKTLPPISDDEKPFELPLGWQWVRLGDFTTIKGGKRLPIGCTLSDTPTSHVYIRVTDMKNETIDDSDLKYISDEVYEQIKEYIIESKDLYITIVGSTIGKVGIVPEKFNNMNLTENAARIIIHGVDKMFLLHMLKTSFMQEQFIDKTNQVGQPKLALIRLKSAIFPLPPLQEQIRIAEKVDSLMTFCNEIENMIVKSKKESDLLMQATLKEAFTYIDTEVNVVDLPIQGSDKHIHWEIAARVDGGINPETQAKISNRVAELLSKKRG